MKSPNSEQAGVAYLTWLREQGHVTAPAATNRPAGTGWSATGFYVVSVVGDSAGPDGNGWNGPILSVDAWAVAAGSGQPPYAHAAGIAQQVRDAVAVGLVPAAPLPVGTGYDRVRIQTAWAVTELRRILEPDGSSYAHYSIDVGLGWVRVPT